MGARALADAVRLGEELVGAWGSWAPALSPDGARIAFVSDRTGTPRLFVQDLVHRPEGAELPEAREVVLTEDPVVEVRWSGDGEWLGCALATGDGARTQVWVVRPDGSDARCVAGSAGGHAELGPWTRTGHRVRVLDLPGDEDVLVRPAPPGTARGEEAPFGEAPLVAYLATDTGLPRRQLVALPLDPSGWRGQPRVLAPRPDVELEGLDADDAGHRLLAVWNVAGGRSELELVDAWTGETSAVDHLPGAVVSGMLLSRDGSTALVAVEGPEWPRELWCLDVESRTWSLAAARPPRTAARLVTPTLEFLHGRDGRPLTGWLYRPPGWTGAGPALLSLRGGTETQERPTFNPQHQAVAAAGIAVFAPDVRGSPGLGRALVHADDLHGQGDAFDDVLACAEFLVRLGVAEPGRVAVSEHSYADPVRDASETTQVVAALRELGRPVKLLPVPGEGHDHHRAESRRLLLGRMLLFLDEALDP